VKDWLGNEFEAGDLVLYPNVSGSSPNMMLARVKDIRGKAVIVVPIKGSRWDNNGRTTFIDTRTGKTVDPYRNESEHMHAQRFLNLETGERTDSSTVARDWPRRAYSPFKDHIRKNNVQTAVRLTVTKNITKWMGPYADETPAPLSD
jgi:hypothetical protein